MVLETDDLLEELGLVRGTMHLVDHERWQDTYERVRHHKVTFDSGGSCANSIATIGWLGGDAVYCGQVGDDQMGAMYADRMEQACGKHALQSSADKPTGKCLSIISATDAERTMLTDLGAAVTLPRIGEFSGALRTAKIAHFTGYTLLDGPMRQIAIQAMQYAKQNGARVSLDAADPFVVLQTKDLLWSLLETWCDIVFLNEEESLKLTDMQPEEAIYHIAQKANLTTVIVKLGAKGSLVLHEGQLHRIEVRKVDPVDTTGAGDAYAGGFLYGSVSGWSADRCGNLASAVAALTVAQVGAVVKDRELLRKMVIEIGGEGVPA